MMTWQEFNKLPLAERLAILKAPPEPDEPEIWLDVYAAEAKRIRDNGPMQVVAEGE